MVEMKLKILREENMNGIITRAKAKWQVDGEWNTRFFYNLEKKTFYRINSLKISSRKQSGYSRSKSHPY